MDIIVERFSYYRYHGQRERGGVKRLSRLKQKLKGKGAGRDRNRERSKDRGAREIRDVHIY